MREHGAEIKREGAKHTIWFIPATGQKSTVPRHNEIKKNTARAICKQLGIDPEKVTVEFLAFAERSPLRFRSIFLDQSQQSPDAGAVWKGWLRKERHNPQPRHRRTRTRIVV